jgi:hypothetical protein
MALHERRAGDTASAVKDRHRARARAADQPPSARQRVLRAATGRAPPRRRARRSDGGRALARDQTRRWRSRPDGSPPPAPRPAPPRNECGRRHADQRAHRPPAWRRRGLLGHADPFFCRATWPLDRERSAVGVEPLTSGRTAQASPEVSPPTFRDASPALCGRSSVRSHHRRGSGRSRSLVRSHSVDHARIAPSRRLSTAFAASPRGAPETGPFGTWLARAEGCHEQQAAFGGRRARPGCCSSEGGEAASPPARRRGRAPALHRPPPR